MNAIAGALDVADAAFHLTVIDTDFHERACLHLRPMQPKGNLIVAVGLTGYRQRQVIEDALVEAVHHGGPMSRGQFDAPLPFLRTAFLTRHWRYFELHACPPWRAYRQARFNCRQP